MITTYYKASGAGLRLALVTDLHEKNDEELVELIRKQEPDAILLAGDILERIGDCEELAEEWQAKTNGKGSRLLASVLAFPLILLTHREVTKAYNGLEFLGKISDIAPIFYSLGNHEWYFTDEDTAMFAEHGITVLDNADVEVVIKGETIRIGGLSTRFDLDWVREYSRKSGYKILLCHHPEYYRKMIMNTELDTFDLILGGHYHGGQWRFFNRAVYVPRLGIMMPDMVGQFGKLIISAGAANSSSIPRLGNPCELVIIET